MAIVNATTFPNDGASYYTCNSIPSWTTGLTVMMWINCSGLTAASHFALAIGAYSSNGRVWTPGDGSLYFYVGDAGQEGDLPNGRITLSGRTVLGFAICCSGTTAYVYAWNHGSSPAIHSTITFTGTAPAELIISGYSGGDGWGSWMQELYVDDVQWTLAQVQAQAAQKTAILPVFGHWHLNGGDGGVATVGSNLDLTGSLSSAATGVDLPDVAGGGTTYIASAMSSMSLGEFVK
jgi:hypothetical protein